MKEYILCKTCARIPLISTGGRDDDDRDDDNARGN